MEPSRVAQAKDPWINKWEKAMTARLGEDAPCRSLRREAEDPATTGTRLEAIIQQTEQAWKSAPRREGAMDEYHYVMQAVVAHSNTPPHAMALHIGRFSQTVSRAFCSNPIAPLVLLEMPDFPAALSHRGRLALMCEATVPPVFVPLIKVIAKNDLPVEEAIRLHILTAGEVGAGNDWQTEVEQCLQAQCAIAIQEHGQREYNIELAEVGLAPSWAKGQPPIPEPLVPFANQTYDLLDEWFAYQAAPNSPEETALLQRIGPTIRNVSVLSRGLRTGATPADLMALLDTTGNERGLVHAAVLRHPAATAEVVAQIASVNLPRFQWLVVQHPQAPQFVVEKFLHSTTPAWRRLARRHPNAPASAVKDFHDTFALWMEQGKVSEDLHFVSFVASLRFGNLRSADAIVRRVESPFWTKRLEAVFIAATNPNSLSGDFAGRTTDDLLHHLCHDGNRLVRAAAKTCLADPSYRFVLGK